MKVFKVVLDGIKLSPKESKELSAAMEKAALGVLRKRDEPPAVKSGDLHELLSHIPPDIIGRVLYSARFSPEKVRADGETMRS